MQREVKVHQGMYIGETPTIISSQWFKNRIAGAIIAPHYFDADGNVVGTQ